MTEREYTVFAFWHETWERFAWHQLAPDPAMAEELTHLEAHRRGGTLGVCGVVEGFVNAVDRHQFVDPSCTSIEQMAAVRSSAGP